MAISWSIYITTLTQCSDMTCRTWFITDLPPTITIRSLIRAKFNIITLIIRSPLLILKLKLCSCDIIRSRKILNITMIRGIFNLILSQIRLTRSTGSSIYVFTLLTRKCLHSHMQFISGIIFNYRKWELIIKYWNPYAITCDIQDKVCLIRWIGFKCDDELIKIKRLIEFIPKFLIILQVLIYRTWLSYFSWENITLILIQSSLSFI